MTTAEDARKKSQKARDDQEIERQENLKKYNREITAIVAAIVKELRLVTLRVVEKASSRGSTSCMVQCYEYSGPEHQARVLAYEKVMSELQEAPHKFQVHRNKNREGYNGEGNNMSDFYTVHSWEISW